MIPVLASMSVQAHFQLSLHAPAEIRYISAYLTMPSVKLHKYARGGWTSLPLQFQIDLNPLNSDLRHTMVFFVYQAPADKQAPEIATGHRFQWGCK
jgi:hypothetical protein